MKMDHDGRFVLVSSTTDAHEHLASLVNAKRSPASAAVRNNSYSDPQIGTWCLPAEPERFELRPHAQGTLFQQLSCYPTN